MNRKLGIILTAIILIGCLVGSLASKIRVFADEEEQEDIYDYLEDIREGVNDISEDLKISIENDKAYYQENLFDNAELNNKLDEGDNDDGSDISDHDNQKYNDNNIDEQKVVTRSGNADPEEATTEEVRNDGENNTICDNDVYKEDLLVIHSDLQKIMLSIWALAGLLLGSKLISRMFGNGR